MSATAPVPDTTLSELAHQYPALLLDAFGVLVYAQGAVPGATTFIDQLNTRGTNYHILTNSAARTLPEQAAAYARHGLAIPIDRIITSGCLLAGHFAATGLVGARCLVLGPAGSRALVEAAGGEVLPPGSGPPEAIVICDEEGFDFLPGVDAALTALLAGLDQGRPPRLVLPNPDICYNHGDGRFGFTAGAICLLLETAARHRDPAAPPPPVDRLGKPHPPIFAEARRRTGGCRAVMVGDQMGTDILGAVEAGYDSALVGTGVTRFPPDLNRWSHRPTWLVSGF